MCNIFNFIYYLFSQRVILISCLSHFVLLLLIFKLFDFPIFRF